MVDYGAILTPAGAPMEDRLETIHRQLTCAIQRYKPQCMAIEQLYFTSNQKTVIAVAQARGVLLLCARQQGLEMTRRILKLDCIPKPDDAADALAIAICHGHTGGSALAKYDNLR